jgi:hypothetical protein
MVKKHIPFINIQNYNPMYLALGLWRACEEYELSRVMAEKKYEINFFLQLTFNPEIQYSRHAFTANDFSLIARLAATNPYFTTIDLYDCQVFDIEAGSNRLLANTEIKFFLKLPYLTTLKLKKTSVNISPYFVTHPSLVWLELAQSKVNDEGLKLLCLNTRIKHLNLSENPGITEEGILCIKRMAALRDLNVRGNSLTNKTALALVKMPNLETLDLSYNGSINDDIAGTILKHVEMTPGIIGLNLRHTSISQPECDAINSAIQRNKTKH